MANTMVPEYLKDGLKAGIIDVLEYTEFETVCKGLQGLVAGGFQPPEEALDRMTKFGLPKSSGIRMVVQLSVHFSQDPDLPSESVCGTNFHDLGLTQQLVAVLGQVPPIEYIHQIGVVAFVEALEPDALIMLYETSAADTHILPLFFRNFYPPFLVEFFGELLLQMLLSIELTLTDSSSVR